MKIARVINWFDEEQTCPADHVVINGNEFEAFTMNDEGHVSLGLFVSCEQACRAIQRHTSQIDQLRHWWPEAWHQPN
jgi:hypothetical protein